MPKKKTEPVEYISVNPENAVLFNLENTEYIEEMLETLTRDPRAKARLYGEAAKRLALDVDKVQVLIVRYVNRLNQFRRRGGEFEKRSDILLKKDAERLCKQVKAHRFVEIRMSHLRGYRECTRCGKVETKYKLKS